MSSEQLPASGPATFRDLQRAIGIPTKRLYAAIDAGEVPARKIGGRVYSRFEWINEFCQTGTWNPDRIDRSTEQPIRPEAV
jgi:hypothetical protein